MTKISITVSIKANREERIGILLKDRLHVCNSVVVGSNVLISIASRSSSRVMEAIDSHI
jgi:hypothetical protein